MRSIRPYTGMSCDEADAVPYNQRFSIRPYTGMSCDCLNRLGRMVKLSIRPYTGMSCDKKELDNDIIDLVSVPTQG